MRRAVLPRVVVLVGLATSAGAIVVGLCLDSKGFVGNLLAEVAGLLLGALLAVLVVDRLLERSRDSAWKLVADGTIRTLEFALVKAALPQYLRLPAPRPPTGDPVSMDGAGELGRAMAVIAAETRKDGAWELPVQPARVLTEFAPHLHVIREVVLPRLLMIGTEPDLVRRIIELEEEYENLDYEVLLDAQFGVPLPLLKARVVDILECMHRLALAAHSSR